MPKRVLITGGSHSEIPLIEAARKLGWYVISTGNNEEGLGHRIADKYIPGDYSDKEFVYRLAREEAVDAIISGTNDYAYLSTAYACERLGIGGHDSYMNACRIHLKSNFRSLAMQLGIRTPKFSVCSDEAECKNAADEIGYPLILKPIDLTGGKGVQRCDSEAEVIAACSEAMKLTRENSIILEKFIDGSEHGITTLIKNQKVVWNMVDNEQYGMNKYLVLGACSPSDIPQFAEYTLINDIEKIAKELELADGIFHVQFILDKDNYPIMIDPCRRAPGDLYILLARESTGMDYPMAIVKAEVLGEVQDSYKTEHNFIARECIMTKKCGVIKKIHISEAYKKYIIYSMIWGKPGDYIDNPMKYKAGIIIMKFPSYEIMDENIRALDENVWISVE